MLSLFLEFLLRQNSKRISRKAKRVIISCTISEGQETKLPCSHTGNEILSHIWILLLGQNVGEKEGEKCFKNNIY